MPTIIGLPGSLRKGSYNRMLLETAAELMPAGAALEIVSIAGFPPYDADLEAESGTPAPVQAIKEKLAAAQGLIIATPEYNHSIPGVAKNAIDWLSRPPRDIRRVFGGLPVALMGATPGRGATLLAQAAWLPVLTALGTRIFSARSLNVAGAAELFAGGRLADEETRQRLEKLVKEFVAFAAAHERKA